MITINVSLENYLLLACRGIDERACIDQELATQIRLQDPNETLAHVEPTDNNLFWLYPIRAWKESAARLAKQRAYSEQLRQEYVLKEQEQQAEAQIRINKVNEFTELINRIHQVLPKTCEAMGRKLIEEMTREAQKGEYPEWKDRLAKKGINL